MHPFVAFIILTGFIILLFAIGILISLTGQNICLTLNCASEAKLMINSIDKNVKPCDNFYKYVCGNYEKSFDKKKSIDSIWEVLEKKTLWKLVRFLKQPKRDKDDAILVLGKYMYSKCIDLESIEKEGLNPLLYMLSMSGGFPLLDGGDWKKTHEEWSIDMGELSAYNNGFTTAGFIEIKVQRLKSESDRLFLCFSIPTALQNSDPDFDRFFKYTTELYTILSGNDTISEEKIKLINDTVNLKIDLVSLTRIKKNCSRNEGGVHSKFQLEPEELLAKVLFDTIKPRANPSKLVFKDGFKEYLGGMHNLTKDLDKHILANYVAIELIIQATPFLPKKLQEIYYKYLTNKEYKSNKILKNRRLNCAKMINNQMSTALSALYIQEQEYSEVEYKATLALVTNRLKRVLKNYVSGVKWMDRKNKIETISKVQTITFTTPLPEDVIEGLTDEVEFLAFYGDLCIDNADSALMNYLDICKFNFGKNIGTLFPNGWVIFNEHYDVFTTNIYFDYDRSSVVVPLVYLKYPAFDIGWPSYLNYGGLGSKIANEMLKGISFAGTKFSLQGNESDWWSNFTTTRYKEERLCFVNQYNDYIVPFTGEKINDSNCVEENIADVTGLIVSHMSYHEYDNERFFDEPKLPGFEYYSIEQMFYISYAFFYCKKYQKTYYTPNMTESEIGTPSNEYRVVSSLQNDIHFSSAFNCKQGDKMNPSKKCKMW